MRTLEKIFVKSTLEALESLEQTGEWISYETHRDRVRKLVEALPDQAKDVLLEIVFKEELRRYLRRHTPEEAQAQFLDYYRAHRLDIFKRFFARMFRKRLELEYRRRLKSGENCELIREFIKSWSENRYRQSTGEPSAN